MAVPTSEVRRATPEDYPRIGELCWEYRAFLMTRIDHVPTIVETYYAEGDYAALIDDLPRIHARPRGDIFVVGLQGRVVGCAMYYPISETTCEIKRIYVTPEARSNGGATKLVRLAIRHAAQDGYARMVLDTIHTLTEAIGLYGKLGFTPAEPFYDPDPAFAETLRFFALPLSPDMP